MDTETKVLTHMVAARKQRVKDALEWLEGTSPSRDGVMLAVGVSTKTRRKRRAELQKEQSMTDEELLARAKDELEDSMNAVIEAVMDLMDVDTDSKDVSESKDVLELIDECVASGIRLALNAHIDMAKESGESQVAALRKMFDDLDPSKPSN